MTYYDQPNYTMVPNKLLDVDMATLSRCELTALLYICRHTLGYGKDFDAISLKQFLEGVTKRDGTRVDSGTGIKSRSRLCVALASLERRGCIIRQHPYTDDGDPDKVVYCLSVPQDQSRAPECESGHTAGGSAEIALPSANGALPSANGAPGVVPKSHYGVVLFRHYGSAEIAPTKENTQKKTNQKKTDKVCGADKPRRARHGLSQVSTQDDPAAATERRLALKLAGDVLGCAGVNPGRLARYEDFCTALLAQGWTAQQLCRWMDWMNSGRAYWAGKARMWSEERMLSDLEDWDGEGRPAEQEAVGV